VAIKRLHPQLVQNEEIASMFEAEARLSARIAHANVVPVLDVVSAEGEILLVMEYVHGEALSKLLAHERAAGKPVPIPVVASVLADVLHGLHAAHVATGEGGAPLRIVHRDVSPQNVLVGADGVTRVVDFGIAKAMGQGAITRDGPLRGKIPYMAPEQLQRLATDRRVDVYAAGVILWEALAGKRLFEGEDEATLFGRVLEDVVPPPSRHRSEVSAVLDGIVARAIARDPDRRFPDARAMALELEAAAPAAPASTVASWVQEAAAGALTERQARIDAMERDAQSDSGEPAAPAIRAPFASVFLTDEAGRPSRLPAVVGSASQGAGAPLASRRLLWLGATSVVAAGAIASFVLGRCSHQGASAATSTSAVPMSSVSSPEASASSDEAAPSASTAVVATPPRSPPGPARTTAPRWCKVFDADKHIYVMRSMRVARCP
jgi:serine/threonine-protein kinase